VHPAANAGKTGTLLKLSANEQAQVIQALTRGMVIVNMRPVHTIPL
jgi:hypothetical protein